MYGTRVLELMQIFSLYTVLVYGLAEIIARPFTRGRGITYRICTDLVVGNFYIIHMMFLLAYVKCLHPPVIIISFLAGTCLIRYLTDRERIHTYCRKKYDILCRLFRGEYGGYLVGQKILQKGVFALRENILGLFRGRVVEVLLLVVALGINVYYFSYQALHVVSYAAPDVEVHLSWIQSLVSGQLFPTGVYPFGMHCVGAAISLVFGISAVTVARMLGVVTSFYIMLLCYLFVRRLCRLRFTPILGFMIFTIANLTVDRTYMRYSAMISQEYAMLFLVPIMLFLYRYLNHKKKQDLVLFGMSFTLTIAVHFYITAIACFFFLAIGMVYIHRMIKRKMLVPIIVCGIISVITALFPLVVGLCMGHPLEQSFTYGASVVMNDPAMYGDDSGDTKQEKPDSTSPKVKVEETGQQLETYLFKDARYIWICLLPVILVVLVWFVHIRTGHMTDLVLEYLSQILYLLLLLAELLAGAFAFPVIIEPRRMGIFIAYMLPLLMAVPLEMLYMFLGKQRFGKVFCNIAALGCLGFACFSIWLDGNVKELPSVYYFQTTGAMKSACDIIKHYEKDSWTIVSPVNETSLVYNSGYHYELLDFIISMEHYTEEMELYIPTEYVFFFVEKMPVENYGFSFPVDDESLRKRPEVNKMAALEDIGDAYSQPEDYYKYKRLQLMSRMYYWAKAYREYYPDEMTVFYEDNEIVVYRLKQNTYALNNLAMDYRKELKHE